MLTEYHETSQPSPLSFFGSSLDCGQDSFFRLPPYRQTNTAEELDLPLSNAQTLIEVCETTGWDYGELWVPSSDAAVLELSPFWHIASSQNQAELSTLEQFRLCSEGFVVSQGEGLPGRVWQSRQQEIISAATDQSESYFLRNQIAKAFGICAGFGVPIMLHEQVSAVLVFFRLNNHL